MRKLWVKDSLIELYDPQQNPAEHESIGTQNSKLARLMIYTSCDKRAWFRAVCHVSDVQNHTAYEKIGWETPIEVRDLYTPYIKLLT